MLSKASIESLNGDPYSVNILSPKIYISINEAKKVLLDSILFYVLTFKEPFPTLAIIHIHLHSMFKC